MKVKATMKDIENIANVFNVPLSTVHSEYKAAINSGMNHDETIKQMLAAFCLVQKVYSNTQVYNAILKAFEKKKALDRR